jgi:hypothetical protein
MAAEREVDKGVRILKARKRLMNTREAGFLVEFQRSFTKTTFIMGE